MKWQPIETAPKDGSRILVWIPGGNGVLSVYWNSQFEYRYDDERSAPDYAGHYLGAWTDNAIKSFGYEELQSYQPTHWMPLPEPPQVEEKAA